MVRMGRVGKGVHDLLVAGESAGVFQRAAPGAVDQQLSDISDKDREFLDAMAAQDGPSPAGQIGAILKAKPNVVPKYRNRLIAKGLIDSAGYGKVDFAIPGLANTSASRLTEDWLGRSIQGSSGHNTAGDGRGWENLRPSELG